MKQLIAGLTLVLALTPSMFAATPPKPAMMMPDCAAMMQEHDAMQKHMTEMDSKVQVMVGEMNRATGTAKVDKVAAVVTELVAQRSMMQKQMMEMHPKMMAHMQSHMMKDGSMSSCPMMSATHSSATAPHKH